MRYIGIDFGSKHIGIALSDESGLLAFPHAVISAKGALATILDIIEKEEVGDVVLGESVNQRGEHNPLMEKISLFKEELEKAGRTVRLEKEQMTSLEARRMQGGNRVDDSAAALILQRFLDRNNKKNGRDNN